MASPGRTVSDLADLLGVRFTGDGAVLVTDVVHDSRETHPGSLYVALRGATVDGHAFIDDAVTKGAVAICAEHPMGSGVAELIVDDTRESLGALSAAVHGNPSHEMAVIGVTGTNGKTTTTHFIESIAGSAGMTTGLIGTIHTRYAGSTLPATLTTPEASEFQRLLAVMRDSGVSLVAAEVSSHALDLGRVSSTRFAVAAFTNLSQDHLDFHGDMDSYRRAKERLFTEYEVGTAVFNVDDPVGADLSRVYTNPSYTVGSQGDVSVQQVKAVSGGRTRFLLDTPWGGSVVTAPVVGAFNLSNLAMAATCCVAAGIDFDTVVAALPDVGGVPGRFEVVSGDDPITVIVDYAHTPEAVVRAVETGRSLTTGRVIALLGAGGDRDRQKRPAMGEALAAADLAIVTSDNPRSEDPETIVAAVLSGVPDYAEHLVEVNRRRAIGLAIGAARDGDVVLVLGRGHEPEQQIAGERIPFDDRAVAAEALRARRSSADYGPTSGSMSP